MLSGWIDTIRDHGGVVFIDLRDHYGTTQIVINDEVLLKGIGREHVISVEGVLQERASDTVNPKLATGEVELKVDRLNILSKAVPQLPFDIGDSTNTREDVRLKYRFLDLRNPTVHQNIITRSEITRFLRNKMEELGFLEIQTPILTSSSPEGARDYLVPSRKHQGPIVKFLSPEKQQELILLLGLKENDTLFFICDVQKLVDKLAGQIRTELGRRLDIIEKGCFEMCFVTDFPMFGINDDTGAVEFTHNPFSMPQGEMHALEEMNPLDIKAYQYDIVCNGVELSSGAVRNHLPDIMIKAFEIAGYSKEVIENKFSALFNAFHYGAPPHAGMAPGLDRIVMLLTEQENIREVVAFPMNSNAQDLLLGAPGTVTELQLREAHIKVR
ncbi:aspartyl/lysyl-trna synthetase [Holotrichia oblita]|nr:aspartyl/lysyl-trna synthetase [Holotrichia oblita]